MWRVAVLHHGTMSSPALSRLREGLRQRERIDGENCVIDAAGAEGRLERLPRLVGELLRRRPHVVAAIGGVAALAAQRAKSTIPVVHAIVLDPAEIGLPAANVAGITTFDPDHGMRQLRLLKELVAGLRTVVCVTDLDSVDGKDALGEIDTNGNNGHGLPFLSELMRIATPSWHLDADRRSLRVGRAGKSLSSVGLLWNSTRAYDARIWMLRNRGSHSSVPLRR